MGDVFKKVRPGDRLIIPARTYNAFIDMALQKAILPSSGKPKASGSSPAALLWAEIMHEPSADDTEYEIKLDAWASDWASGQSYVQHSDGPPEVAASVVKYNDREWTCILSHTSASGKEPPNSTYWEEVTATKGYPIYEVGDLSTCSPVFYAGKLVPVVLEDEKYWILQTFTQCGIAVTVGEETHYIAGSNIWVPESANDSKGRLASIYV